MTAKIADATMEERVWTLTVGRHAVAEVGHTERTARTLPKNARRVPSAIMVEDALVLELLHNVFVHMDFQVNCTIIERKSYNTY